MPEFETACILFDCFTELHLHIKHTVFITPLLYNGFTLGGHIQDMYVVILCIPDGEGYLIAFYSYSLLFCCFFPKHYEQTYFQNVLYQTYAINIYFKFRQYLFSFDVFIRHSHITSLRHLIQYKEVENRISNKKIKSYLCCLYKSMFEMHPI